ncbi:C-C motif chemokine 3-like [Petaurus breviceps papuanus]|uniref:C-C motif chemokine 3-like n=1 Tax=Petaurus breviceps papuanus TaxID=3040969 RepID=UPI0036DC053F
MTSPKEGESPSPSFLSSPNKKGGERSQILTGTKRHLEALETTCQAQLLIPSTMKVSTAALTLVLIAAALCCQVHASPDGPGTPTCCFDFTSKKIPSKLVVSYGTTSSRCAKEGVIFITRQGYNICANPKEQWVQHVMKQLKSKKAKTQSP